MGVERLVTRIADHGAGESGEMNVLVLREYEFRNQQVRQNRFVEIVAKLQTGVGPSADQFLHLERHVAQARCVKWIFRCTLQREAAQRTPCLLYTSRCV